MAGDGHRTSKHGIDQRKGTAEAKPESVERAPKAAMAQMGSVSYLNGDALEANFELPRPVRLRALLIVLAAIILGAAFLFVYFDQIVNAPAREQEAVQESLSKQASFDFPLLSELLPLSDADIMAALSATGETLFEKTPVGSGSSFEVIKLPSDVSLADAGAMYLTGISKLSPSQAVKLLNGSWDLDVNREKGMNMSLHYADFVSGSAENAVQAALQAQGLDTASITDSGVDGSGNVYSSGNLVIGDATYAWKVSSVPLADVYEIPGVPESAAYVGVRFTS